MPRGIEDEFSGYGTLTIHRGATNGEVGGLREAELQWAKGCHWTIN